MRLHMAVPRLTVSRPRRRGMGLSLTASLTMHKTLLPLTTLHNPFPVNNPLGRTAMLCHHE